MKIDNEKTIELKGFQINVGNIIISDSDKMGDWKPVTVHLTPSMLKFLLEQNERTIEDLCDIEIW